MNFTSKFQVIAIRNGKNFLGELLPLAVDAVNTVAITRVQAQLWCTTSSARKVVISLTLVALIAEVINWVCLHVAHVGVVDDIYDVFKMLVTVAVLVINVVVVHQVRRSATNAAANLGVQQHHQSTSSNSVVPTVMLIATSLVYVLLYGAGSILRTLFEGKLFDPLHNFSYDTWVIGKKIAIVVYGLAGLIFAYNFYIYFITGKRFRSELYRFFFCCLSFCSSCSSAPPPSHPVVVDDDNNTNESRPGQSDTNV